MKRPFNSKEADRIYNISFELFSAVAENREILLSYTNEVKKTANDLLDRNVSVELDKIPVEELNRNKKGFRVKTLRDNGFDTFLKLYETSLKSLIDINGISKENAFDIKQIVNDSAAILKNESRIRLSLDDKNPQASSLVLALVKRKLSIPHLRFLTDISSIIKKDELIQYLKEFKSGKGTFSFFFSSRNKKEKVCNAFDILSKFLNDHENDIRTTINEAKLLNLLSYDQAWDSFTKHPISLLNILESLVPGSVGFSDSKYGLPEEIAAKVLTEELDLSGIHCELRKYQELGVKYIIHQKRVLLGDEMGLGKTVQAIAAMIVLKNRGAKRFLVICPASVMINWWREITRFSNLNAIKIHGKAGISDFEKWKEIGGVAITSYETTEHLVLEDGFNYDMAVVDEAHYIKNNSAKRTINTKILLEHTDNLLFMTGTALENKVSEMIELIKILNPEIAASLIGKEMLSKAEAFRKLLAPVYYRRKREDVLTELPELIVKDQWVDISREEEQLYEAAVLNHSFNDARRISWNVDDISKSSKARRLYEIAELSKQGERKLIVFSFFLDTLEKVSKLLSDRCLETINGSVSFVRRQQILDEFEKAPAGAVLPVQIQAGGTGLNIQAASVVIFCEPQLKPSIENQAVSRAYRMGQTRNVIVSHLLCDNTIDEKIMDMLLDKQIIFDAFADVSEAAKNVKEQIGTESFDKIMKEEEDRIKTKEL
ncbi:MAG: DEAD/DEAH box helicase [Eubacterium sp.]|nr:DEAD/DEAH box helicase [Eubacterium sp.]